MGILILISLLAVAYLIFAKKKTGYRLKIYDKLNGQYSWVTHVDGISETISYSSNPDVAIIYRERSEAERVAKLFVTDLTTFIIEEANGSVFNEIQQINK